MKLAVKNYGANAFGIDTNFPVLCAEIGDTDPLPSGFDEILTLSAYATRKTSTQGSFNNNLDAGRLEELKEKRFEEIDRNTTKLIKKGFEYPASSGNIYSLSELGQINLIGLELDKAAITFPKNWTTKDNQSRQEIADTTEATTFHLTALGTKIAHLDSGSDLKESIRAATTKAEVDAIVDNR